MTVDAPTFVSAATATMQEVATTQLEGVRAAAALLRRCLDADGVVQAFGTGHSEAFAMEVAGRAGGLVPTNRLTLRDPVVLGHSPADVLGDTLLERDPATAHRIYELIPQVQPQDVFVIASNSGANGSIVEFATLVKEKGHDLIAVTSMQHTTQVPPRHPSGKKLYELADVVLDNGAPYGDAILPLPGGGAACGVSSLTAAMLAQMMLAEVLNGMLADGVTPPVYLSANIPGGDEHNNALEARYAGRLRRLP
ncbi:sugar isomerase domain-containing protein [Auraticoccus sp. F435]|uniref:Sugar isomerase domain-containing protein n=1 Tax=Auraticoccus cholistanensis TaxID=2656650 RepID=A0A6A9UPX9_9ACTN|nr:SIS domain-containing protein [Auraticoccus cholistanensis]MVA74598.1 sugar isomerase domain-containing protein [Auraticoccus cholistanensis]